MILDLDNYHIVIGSLEDSLKNWLDSNQFSKLILLVDENTEQFCLPLLKSKCSELRIDHIVQVNSGENHKTVDTCQHIWNELLKVNADRNACLINLGGGVIGDMGGFCAATFKRGIQFLQIPTTLLSMVDSSIGGKLGVDFANLKNVIGVFENPSSVLIDTDFLDTLDRRQIYSGFAETIKHALIADKTLWAELCINKDLTEAVDDSLVPSLEVKRKIVAIDPFEKKERKALNFGHTVGHALETYFLSIGKNIYHGEAVLLGIIAESYLSVLKSSLKEEELGEIVNFIQNHYDLDSFDNWSDEEILRITKNDKKNKEGIVLCTVLPEIGSFEVDVPVSEKEIIDSLEYLRKTLVRTNI